MYCQHNSLDYNSSPSIHTYRSYLFHCLIKQLKHFTNKHLQNFYVKTKNIESVGSHIDRHVNILKNPFSLFINDLV